VIAVVLSSSAPSVTAVMLAALMQDQIAALRQLNVPCAMLSSKTSQEEQKEILQDMTSGHPKNRLLYSELWGLSRQLVRVLTLCGSDYPGSHS
jgi:bloom syndrome protein